jgi:hypothetical protein
MKKPKPKPISEIIKELHDMIVDRSVYKTDKYDKRIAELEKKIDYFHYGV